MATDTIPEPQTMRPTLAAEHGEGHFGFLSLAPEVRNQVYEALFEHTEPLRIADTDGYGVRLHRYLLEGSSRLEFSSKYLTANLYIALTKQSTLATHSPR